MPVFVYVIIIIIAIIAAVILLALFYPIKYKLDGRIEEKINIRLYINWLGRFFTFTLIVKDSGSPTMRFSVLFVKRTLKKKEEEKDVPKKDKEENEAKDTERGEYLKKGIEFFKEKENQEFIKYALSRLKIFLKKIIPDEIRTNLNFSLGSPQYTGLATGAMSLFPIIYMFDIGIYPDFMADKSYIRGTFHVNGKIRNIYTVAFAISLLKKKQFRNMISSIRRSKNG